MPHFLRNLNRPDSLSISTTGKTRKRKYKNTFNLFFYILFFGGWGTTLDETGQERVTIGILKIQLWHQQKLQVSNQSINDKGAICNSI